MVTMLNPYTGQMPTTAVKNGTTGESAKRTQMFLNWCLGSGLVCDGIAGKKTVTAIKKYQRRYGLSADGIFGSKSIEMAEYIIDHQPWLRALYDQYQASKKAKYGWVDRPTIENSKKKCSCIALHSVGLQRLKILNSGWYFYLNPKTNRIAGNADDFVKKHKELFYLKYPNKTINELVKEGKIMPFDIVGYDDPGYHSAVYAGLSQKGKPLYFSAGSKKKWFKTYSYYGNRPVGMIVRLKKTTR